MAVPTHLDVPLSTAVLTEEGDILPQSMRLEQNYPNPFNSQTVIRFSLAQQTELELAIYNLLGQKVAALLDQRRPAGEHVVSWNGRDETGAELASGVYVYRLRTESHVATRKLLLLR